MRRHRQLPFGPINIVDINQFVATPRRVMDVLPAIPKLNSGVVANNPPGGLIAVNPNFRSGYAQRFNLQLQRQNFNQAVPGPGAPAPRRPLFAIAPNVISATYNVFDGLSNYHSLQAALERRFASGVGFLAAYTWSRPIDVLPNSSGGAGNGPIPQDRRNIGNDRAVSEFDIAHPMTRSPNYASPSAKGASSAAVQRCWTPSPAAGT